MKKLIFLSLLILAFSFPALYAQVEDVTLGHDVYTFLKEMKVKKVIAGIHDDTPNMSYSEVKNFLQEIDKKKDELSRSELELLNKFKNEFYTDEYSGDNTSRVFNPANSFWGNLSEFTSDKEKFLYYLQNDYLNFYANGIAHATYAQSFSTNTTNTELYDLGFRAHGTLLNNLGYSFSFSIGNVNGSRNLASIVDPRLKYNFKFVENSEPISNYDYTEGYLRYAITPADNMLLALQLGREKFKFGYGYSNSLAISGEGPLMDLLRFDFRYGIFSFTSIHASTVGEYENSKDERYTKYIASNKLKVAIPDLFDIGIGESIVYSGRGLEWAYINPLLFYKYAEMSLQDRDNGTLFLDFQTSFIKDFELQGTFFLDEDILSNLQDLQLFSNKTAYQLGFQWYEPFNLSDLSFTCEYTKIRPYVYTHDNYMNTFTAFGVNLGHRIGPNSDEILTRLCYNLSGSARLSLEYRHQRSGKNVVDANGVLVKNVGGDVFQPYRYNVDDTHPAFLDGVRYNYDYITAGIHYEPWREIFFDLLYNFTQEKNITAGTKSNLSYLVLKMSIEY
jgi:hypothetical protein